MNAKFLVLILFFGAGLLFFLSRPPSQEEKSVFPDRPPPREREPEVPPTAPNGLPLTEDLSLTMLKGYGSADSTPLNDLELIFGCLETFYSHLKGRSELPASGNQELTTVLLGDNNDRIRFISPEFPFLNQQGELTDRWQTPIFFHFQNDLIPDIRSAGPDQKMWTPDDILRPH